MRRLTLWLVVVAGFGMSVGCETKTSTISAPTGVTTTVSTGVEATPASHSAEKLAGEIRIDGSSTVAPITSLVAEEFGDQHPDVRIPVGISGTSGGFKQFVRGDG